VPPRADTYGELRVVGTKDDDADRPPVLIVEEAS
jgi:hypothetical protein